MNGIIILEISTMKIMCQCGRDVRHEPPFDDFHVERVKCSASCMRAEAVTRDLRLPDPRPRTPAAPLVAGMRYLTHVVE
jgi:hypothetical protein